MQHCSLEKKLPGVRRRSVTCSLEDSYVFLGINQDGYTKVTVTSLRICSQQLPNVPCRLKTLYTSNLFLCWNYLILHNSYEAALKKGDFLDDFRLTLFLQPPHEAGWDFPVACAVPRVRACRVTPEQPTSPHPVARHPGTVGTKGCKDGTAAHRHLLQHGECSLATLPDVSPLTWRVVVTMMQSAQDI